MKRRELEVIVTIQMQDLYPHMKNHKRILAMYDEHQAEIERLKDRTWTDNVQFIAAAKENLLQQYVNLTQMYGEQKHQIRDLKVEVERLQTQLTAEKNPHVTLVPNPVPCEHVYCSDGVSLEYFQWKCTKCGHTIESERGHQ